METNYLSTHEISQCVYMTLKKTELLRSSDYDFYDACIHLSLTKTRPD